MGRWPEIRAAITRGRNGTIAQTDMVFDVQVKRRSRESDGVTIGSWREHPHSRWAFRNVSALFNIASVENDPTSARSFARAARMPPSSVLRSAFMATTVTSALIVLSDGEIILEHYAHGNEPDTPQILMSATKRVMGLLLGILHDRGDLAIDKPVTEYVSEVADTAFADATPRQLIDMRTGVVLDERETLICSAAAGWDPVPVGVAQQCLHQYLASATAYLFPIRRMVTMSREQRERINAELGRPAVAASVDHSIENIRAGFAAFMATMRVPSGTRSSATALGGRRTLLVDAEQHPRTGTILYFHGGSFLMGSPETAMALTASLVVRTGMRSFSLDYRLAPEHPFPAAIEDCVSAYRDLLDQGVPPASIAFAGDSAGGGLCITTCLKARSEGLPLPAAIVTFSAGLDATRSGESVDAKNGIDPFFTRDSFRASGSMYVGGADPNQELLSPAVMADLTGFPPLLLQVGTNELLLDDSTRLAARARDAEVDVILDVTANVPHVFQGYTGVLEEADQALDRAALFPNQHVDRTR